MTQELTDLWMMVDYAIANPPLSRNLWRFQAKNWEFLNLQVPQT